MQNFLLYLLTAGLTLEYCSLAMSPLRPVMVELHSVSFFVILSSHFVRSTNPFSW